MKSIADEMFPELSEQEIEDLVTSVPPKDRRLITSAVDFSVSTLLAYIRDATIRIPNFQRNYVWSQVKASRLIESLIMQCPVPVIYLSRTPDGGMEVVDGNQRLTSIRRFVDENFELKGLTAFPELANSHYSELDARFQRHIQSRTIRCVIIEPESHPQIKFDVFERLNSGSTPLNAQELRHGIYSGPFMEMLRSSSSDRVFVRATGVKNDPRMRRDELALRFFALSDGWKGYEKPLGNFLNLYCEKNRNSSEARLVARKKKLLAVMEGLESVLGGNPFRFSADGDKIAKFNTAYFDAISVGFAASNLSKIAKPELAKLSLRVKKKIGTVISETRFQESVLRATSDEAAVKYRVSSILAALNSVG